MKMIGKKLLSFVLVAALVLSLAAPAIWNAPVQAAEEETLAAEIQAAAASAIPAEAQAKIDAAAKVPSSDADIQKHIDAKTCPMCGATGVTWTKLTSGANKGGTQNKSFHYYSNSAFSRSGNVIGLYNSGGVSSLGNTFCYAMMSGCNITNNGTRFLMMAGTNNTVNIMGTGKVTTYITVADDAGKLNNYGAFQLDGSGCVLNLYGGTYVYKDNTSENATNVGAYAAMRKGSGTTVNIYNNAIIGPDEADLSSYGYNVMLNGGTMNMYGGTIRNGVSDHANRSGNVTVAGTSTFNMYGGTITGGTYMQGEGITSKETKGGNVLVGGHAQSATSVTYGKFNMYGGTISGGTAYRGGNVGLQSASSVFSFYGGKLEGGNATQGGNLGGIQGTIQTYNGAIVNGVATRGGNVYYYVDKDTAGKNVYLYGGVISGGTADMGGNVYVSSQDASATCLYMGNDEARTLKVYNGTTNAVSGAGGGNVYSHYCHVTIGANATLDGGVSKSTNYMGGGNVCVVGSRTLTTSGKILNGKTTGAGGGGNICIASSAAWVMNGGVVANGRTEGSSGTAWGGNLRGYNNDVTINDGLIYGGYCKNSNESYNMAVLTGESTAGADLKINGGVIVGRINTSAASTYTKSSVTYNCPATNIVLTGAPKLVKQWTLDDGTAVKAEYNGLRVQNGNTVDISGLSAGAQICIYGAKENQALTTAFEGTEALQNCFWSAAQDYCVTYSENQLFYTKHTKTNIVKTAATCEATGYSADYLYCATCDEYLTSSHSTPVAKDVVITPALGHKEVIDAAVAADCTNTGLTEGKHCSVCNEVIVAQETVAALGHDYVAETTPADCENDGKTVYTCSVCGDSYEEIIPAGHNIEYKAAVIPANCLETGHDEYWYCTGCEACFGDAEGSYQINPAWINYTGEHVRPEGSVVCAVVPCELCGEDTYGEACDRGDAPVCQDATCVNCGETVWGWGCNYNTGDEEVPLPLCQPGTCVYCGTEYEKLYDCENGAWATCLDGECAYGCGKQFPATTAHNVEDPCAGGMCMMCWNNIEGAHTEVTDEAVAPDCTNTGLTEGKHCSVCNEVIVAQETVAALGHDYVAETTPADCENDGKTVYTCSVCGDSYEEIIPGGHKIVYMAAVIPENCLETGHDEYWYCTGCEACFGDAEGSYQINPAWINYTGEHVRPEGSIVCAVVACELCGEDTYGEACDRGDAPVCQDATCVNCGETVWGWGCNYNTGDEEVPLPLCQPGTCVYCGTEYEKLYDCENGAWATCLDGECAYGCGKQFPATTAHNVEDPCAGGMCMMCWNNIEGAHTEVTDEAVAPDCTNTGLTEGKHCDVCGEVLVAQELVDALGHTEETVAGKAPTCTETGLTEGTKCSVCNEVIIAQEEIAAAGHSIELLTEGTPATCLKPGTSAVYTCTVCEAYFEDAVGKSEQDSETPSLIMPDGHELTKVEAQAATCEGTGNVEHYLCSVCGNAYAENAENASEAINPVTAVLGHSYTNYIYNNDATYEADGTETATCDNGCGKTDTRTAEGTKLLGAAQIGETTYKTLQEAVEAAQAGETIVLLDNVDAADEIVLLMNGIKLDLNGKTLKVNYLIATTGGSEITDSTDGEGVVIMAKKNLTMINPTCLPVWDAEVGGYHFVTVEMAIYEAKKDASVLELQYWFKGAFDGDMKQHLAKVAENDLKVVLRVNYTYSDGSVAVLDIVIPAEKVVEYANTAYQPYFKTTIRGLNALGDATITVYATYGEIEIPGETYDYTAVAETPEVTE